MALAIGALTLCAHYLIFDQRRVHMLDSSTFTRITGDGVELERRGAEVGKLEPLECYLDGSRTFFVEWLL